MRHDGSDLRKITDDLNKDRGVAWVNDQRLIFYSNEGGGYDIWSDSAAVVVSLTVFPDAKTARWVKANMADSKIPDAVITRLESGEQHR